MLSCSDQETKKDPKCLVNTDHALTRASPGSVKRRQQLDQRGKKVWS